MRGMKRRYSKRRSKHSKRNRVKTYKRNRSKRSHNTRRRLMKGG